MVGYYYGDRKFVSTIGCCPLRSLITPDWSVKYSPRNRTCVSFVLELVVLIFFLAELFISQVYFFRAKYTMV